MTTRTHPADHRFRPRVESLGTRRAPAVTFRFDYSPDTSGFFDDPAARAALQRAADAVSTGLQDSLLPIAPSGGNTWRAAVVNPVTGAAARFDDLTVGADEVLVFVAAGDLPRGELGATVPGTASPRGSRAW